MKKTFFGIDGLEGGIFEGYHSNEYWNGWACPYFPLHSALEIVGWFASMDEYDAKYDEKSDSMVIIFAGEEPEIYPTETITFEGEEIKVWSIGGGAWIWQEIINVKSYDFVDYFQGKVLLAYQENENSFVLDVELWQFSEDGNIRSRWQVQVNNKQGTIRSHDDLLLELQKEYYINQGCSETF